MEEKHLLLSGKNPDPNYQPFVIEFQNYKEEVNQFLKRFEEVHKEFYVYVKLLE